MLSFIVDRCLIYFLIVLCVSLVNTSDHVMRTRRQFNSLHKSDSDIRNNFVHDLFSKNGNYNATLLNLIGKALAEKNDEFNGLKSSKVDHVDAYFDVVNKAFDDTMNSLINLTIIIKASQQRISNPTRSNVHPPQKEFHRPDQKDPKQKTKTKTSSGGKLSTFDKAVLQRHNFYRQKHSAQPLVYSSKISQVSQEWANSLAERNVFEHRPNGEYGENIYAIRSTDPKFKVSGETPVDSWYSEISNYTFTREPNVDLIMKTGHFTQLIWKGSHELGVGLAQSTKTKMYYIVCNYDPRGNWIGEFMKNVSPPK